MKGSKWTWLRDKCLELGYIEAAELAQEIEDVLYKIYGTTKTEAGERTKSWEIEDAFNRDPVTIISSDLFCPGCMTCGWCEDCKFGKAVGICGTKGALFTVFRETFKMEEKQMRRGNKK
jgi:hypothetical protein